MLRSPRSRLLVAAALAVLASPTLLAQTDSFLYTLSAKGQVAVNATELEKLSGNYKPGDEDGEVNGQQRWLGLEVEGNDRYMLRVDGRLAINGELGPKLPFSLLPNDLGVIPFWYRLEVYEGAIHAVRTDGMVSVDGDTSLQLPKQEGQFIFGFSDLCAVPIVTGHDLYVLRVDGAIWRVGDDGPGFLLRGDVPPEGETEPETEFDGRFSSTAWMLLEYDSVTGLLYAVRRDGVVMSMDPADYAPIDPPPGTEPDPVPPSGTVLARLRDEQAPSNTSPPIETYPQLAFDADGRWLVLRYDGRLYRASAAATPEDPIDGLEEEVNFTGAGTGDPYVGLGLLGEAIYVLREGGRVFEAAAPDTEVFEAKGGPFGYMAITADPPDGTFFKNNKPQLIQYKPTLSTDDSAEIPILPWDIDLAAEDIEVTVDLSDAQEDVPGVSFDAETRLVSWPAGAPKGNYKIAVTLDDGEIKKPKTYKLTVKVKPADDKPEKNKPPLLTKINKAVGFIGKQLVLPVIVSDLDGDVLTVEVLDKKGDDAFDRGAVFDAKTNTISWTPTQADLGKHNAYLLVQEVGPEKPKTKKLKIKIEILSQLVFAAPEDEG